MIDVTEWTWAFNNTLIVCRYVEDNIVINIEKRGNSRMERLKDIPIELLKRIAEQEHGEKIIKKLVRKAEDDFFRAYLGES